jgi:hypothetical protein
MAHFWYSLQAEINEIRRYVEDIRMGMLDSWSFPRYNSAFLEIEGETVEVRYTICSDQIDAYERPEWDLYSDKVYLGCGKTVKCGTANHEQMIAILTEAGYEIPNELLQPMRKMI